MKIVCLFVCTFIFVLVTEIQAGGVPEPPPGPGPIIISPPIIIGPPITISPPIIVPPTERPRCQCSRKQLSSDANRGCRTCNDLACKPGWVCNNVRRNNKRRCCRCEPVCVRIWG